MNDSLLEYYAGDELAASVWEGKYAAGAKSAHPQFGTHPEQTPQDMHWRIAKKLAEIEEAQPIKQGENLSIFGTKFEKALKAVRETDEITTTTVNSHWNITSKIAKYLARYKYIIPQGSIMSMLGTNVVGSLSNCFVIPSPVDSYGGIFQTDQHIAQLEKRRGGVGLNLNTLRPEGTKVENAAGTSTGAHSFMDRFSGTTREVAQNGRRGALMLLMDCRHPDIFKFVTKKADLTKVTGANISVMLTDGFMEAVKKDEDFICKFPVDSYLHISGPVSAIPAQYNVLTNMPTNNYAMKIKAKELYEEIVNMAWSNGEPGVAFIDRIHKYSPEGVYEQYKAVASNPCGEQWMQAYDACRLLALNLYNVVNKPFTEDSTVDWEKLYEIAYVQQRLADDIVELEIRAIDKIMNKIIMDPEPPETKATEFTLWENIRKVAAATRRTGCGFTALADMLAALGLKYDSDEALGVIEKVMKTKMRAELDCTIDLAILRGPFEGWDSEKEFVYGPSKICFVTGGKNDFYQMLVEEFPEQCERMCKHGRRNLNWSTVAPTGTVSIVALLNKYANTSAGVEPQFSCYYLRNRKINPSDENLRVDFVDKNGDSWMTYPVVMGGLKEWIDVAHPKAAFVGVDNLPKETIEELFKKSPYYKSCANDIKWERRIEIQALVQKYTTNAISSTLNLPANVSKETVSGIYEQAWKQGLKGVTIYRDGCRTGVLNVAKKEGFEYKDAVKRPKEIEAHLHVVNVKGVKYGVVIGLVNNNPYEIFAFNLPDEITDSCKGKTIKVKRGHYNFICDDATIKDMQIEAIRNDEQVLTRLISGMLRHGAKPQFVMEQIDKCELEVVSFGKAISRTLKKYCVEEELISRAKCSNCGSSDLKMQEGCLICKQCGNSKCG